MCFSYKKITYSQYGEDLFLRECFKNKCNGFFVDVGAFHPRQFSNTYYLYRKGWHGINIDAQPNSSKLFNAIRQRDKNIECLISEKSGEQHAFASWGTNAENSALPTQIEGVKSKFKKEPEKIFLSAKTLTDVLDNHVATGQKIDFLSIDAEGMDMSVIASLNWERYHPEIVLIESYEKTIESILKTNIYNFMIKHQYDLVSWYYQTLMLKKYSRISQCP